MAQESKDPVLSNLRIKVVKATQIGTVIKPRPKEQHTTVQSRKVHFILLKIESDSRTHNSLEFLQFI